MKKILALLLAGIFSVQAITLTHLVELNAYVNSTAGVVNLIWTDTALDETGWEVQVFFTRTKQNKRFFPTPENWNTLEELPANSTAVAVEYGLRGYYYFRVRPVSTDGTLAPWSNQVVLYIR